MSPIVQMHREYVANGSRYHAELWYTASEADEPTSFVVDIGEVYSLPMSAKKLAITLRDAERTEILRNLKVNDGKDSDTSTIITEEGSIAHGQNSGRDGRDWMWKSDSDGTNHRPRKFFVANASGGEIEVQPEPDDGTSVRLKNGKTDTFEHDSVKIIRRTFIMRDEQIMYHGTVEPRTSIVICPEKIRKTTGRLYGKNITSQMWVVHGDNYKPASFMKTAKTIFGLIGVASVIYLVFRGSRLLIRAFNNSHLPLQTDT